MNDILEIYKGRINLFSSHLATIENKISLISKIRLAIVISTLVFVYVLFKNDYQIFSGVLFLSGLAVFIILIIYHEELFNNKNKLINLISINEKGVKRLTDQWHSFMGTGDEFMCDNHPYTSDIDIFGNNSLYQYINATHTYYGKHFLASSLRGESINQEQIKQNQDAIRELALLLSFRQNIEEAALSNQCIENPDTIINWSETNNKNIVSRKLENLLIVLPYFSFLVLLADILLFKTIFFPVILYAFQIILFLYQYKKNIKLFNILDKQSGALNCYTNIIRAIEKTEFFSLILQKLQMDLSNNNNLLASRSTAILSKILTKSDIRYNPVLHFIVNSFWLWDIKCAIEADRWKEKNGKHIRLWFEAIGHIEKLSSLSIIHFEHPSWAFPDVSQSDIIINAQNIRHPLISKTINVGNDFILSMEKNTVILTGSNMSGKSTFLRTIAINLILAYTGSPVCATKLTCGMFNIYTSMRTKDNLTSHVSTFFSELYRIKKIVDMVNSDKKVIYLIDEIFSGTNSQDRVIGAIAVLKALQLDNAIGIISTHDLELCRLAYGYESKFVNYHFREYYDNNNILFDYKIYLGPSETRNALFLIKMVGIPINDGLDSIDTRETVACENHEPCAKVNAKLTPSIQNQRDKKHTLKVIDKKEHLKCTAIPVAE